MRTYTHTEIQTQKQNDPDPAEGLGRQVPRGEMSLPEGVQELETMKVNDIKASSRHR